ncbi:MULTISPECIES: LysR family transcriptional regulator [Burkholderiaceae]|uniref:Transcriptional regulator, LysR family n=1 Tax=Caballeronia sordidicola TaxID=196367 RepID=A0A242N880_CABSO|nr:MULTISPECIES: LysR family transcriptional regulator [Burkholderiaceae]AME28112.1 LysR family transcriptional regulator [Burkholderia sp. PAMC 26561]OTP79792.1 Transcriptional regulator, LysR family [Caballeronia sordidicola]
MDRLDAMAVLLAAVEGGSLSKASRQLKLPLATVSRKIADLESHLKATVFIRSTKGLELTPAGRTYVTAAKAILERVVEAERAVAGEYTEPKGDLVVTAPIMFGRLHVLPVVSNFLSAFPDVSIGLELTDRVTHFLDDQVDVALRVGELPDSNLVAVGLGSIRRVVCASPTYLATRDVPSTPHDLVRHDAISFDSVSVKSQWSFWSGGEEFRVPIRSRLSVNTIDAAIDAGLSGSGLIRTMSYQVVELVRRQQLVTVLNDFEPPKRPVHLVYDKQNRLPLKLRAFVDFVVPRLRDRVLAAAL